MVSKKLVAVWGLFLGLIVLQAYYNLGSSTYLEKGYPQNTSMFTPAEKQADFYVTYLQGALLLKGGNPYTDVDLVSRRVPSGLLDLPAEVKRVVFRMIYFPLTAWVAAAIALLSPAAAVWIFSVLMPLGVIGVLFYQSRTSVERGDRAIFLWGTAPLLLSHPFLFMLDRGNWEGLILLLCWSYVLLYRNGNKWAWVWLAVAASFKPHAALFGLLPLLDEDYQSLLKSAAATLAITVVSLWALPGGLVASLSGLREAVAAFTDFNAMSLSSIRFNHTLFNLLKGWGHQVGFVHLLKEEGLAHRIRILSRLSSTLSVGIAAAAIRRLWKTRKTRSYSDKVLAVVVMMIALVPINYDYALIELFPVFAFLVADLLKDSESRDGRWTTLLLLTLVLAPKEYAEGTWTFPFGPGYMINGVLLLALLFRSVSTPCVAATTNGGRAFASV